MDGNLLRIDGNVVKKFIRYDILYEKQWAEDTGRNMAGTMEGTLIGIFPKLQIEIGSCDENELIEIISLLNQPSVEITYYDSELQKFETADYYSDNVLVSLKSQKKLRYNSYTVNLTPIKRRKL